METKSKILQSNKVYAVKKNDEWWAVIDCGKGKKGGMITGNYWKNYFEKQGRTYRWFRKLSLVPDNIVEWQEIKIKEEFICRIAENQERNIMEFEGWIDQEDSAFLTLQNFAELLGHKLSIEEIKNITIK